MEKDLFHLSERLRDMEKDLFCLSEGLRGVEKIFSGFSYRKISVTRRMPE